MRLAYADPPYPGKADRYREQEEVDHAELIERLSEYDGWALSTDEINLRDVLNLCPPRTRIAAWCRTNSTPLHPFPYAAWEPVLFKPARINVHCVPNFLVGKRPDAGFCENGSGLIGSKTEEFCEFVIRCLGAEPDDDLTDVFPGSGVMAKAWDRFKDQPPLFNYGADVSRTGLRNQIKRSYDPIPGLESDVPDEREWKTMSHGKRAV